MAHINAAQHLQIEAKESSRRAGRLRERIAQMRCDLSLLEDEAAEHEAIATAYNAAADKLETGE